MKLTLGPTVEIALHEACSVIKMQSPRTLARLAIDAVCQEIVNQGSMPLPLAVSLRFQSDEEIEARGWLLRASGGVAGGCENETD